MRDSRLVPDSVSDMCTTIRIVLAMVREAFLSCAALHLENLALRQQLAALDRKGSRPSLRMADRLFWVVLSRLWSGWREILVIVKPETVIGWHRKGFRRFWTRKSRRGKPGRPPVSSEVRGLIRRMSRENPLWGAPRIHGELRMLGFEVSEAAVSKYMPRHPKPPSQTWRTFLEVVSDSWWKLVFGVAPDHDGCSIRRRGQSAS